MPVHQIVLQPQEFAEGPEGANFRFAFQAKREDGCLQGIGHES
jgi:hypothetical protein